MQSIRSISMVAVVIALSLAAGVALTGCDACQNDDWFSQWICHLPGPQG